MGRTLIHAFSSSESDLKIVACNRSPQKLDQIINDYPSVQAAASPVEVAQRADVVFLCVKPGDAGSVVESIAPYMCADQFLISIISSLTIHELESMVSAQVIKVIPSITQEARAGVALVIPSRAIQQPQLDVVLNLLSHICTPQLIQEQDIRICADLTSCGPAFLAFLLREISQSAARQGDISIEFAEDLVKSMLVGTAKLIAEANFSLDDIIERVSVPGGVTAAGIDTLRPAVAGIFDHLFATTRAKGAAHQVDRVSR